MGALLTARFLRTLSSLEDLNRTLETRVADRERALAANYARLAALEREHAASEERQLIMRDLHDGLGSQLFTSLSRVERGDMDDGQIASRCAPALPTCGSRSTRWPPDEHDLGAALGNFMFRWEAQLLAAGVRPAGTSTCRKTATDPLAARRAAVAAGGAGGADQRAQACPCHAGRGAAAPRRARCSRWRSRTTAAAWTPSPHGRAAAMAWHNMRSRAQRLGGSSSCARGRTAALRRAAPADDGGAALAACDRALAPRMRDPGREGGIFRARLPA